MSTTIEWTEETWNPLRGCRRVSPGCEHCYAERQAARPILSGPGKPYEGLVRIGEWGGSQRPTRGPRWTGRTSGVDKLDEPLRWKKPRRVFPCSMSDLFYEGFDDEQIAEVFASMALAHWHTFQALTKRAARAASLLGSMDFQRLAFAAAARLERRVFGTMKGRPPWAWPLPNVWLGTSVEDQERAEERLPHLLATPAAVRFVSFEPALGPVDFGPWLPRWRRTADRADVTDVRVPGIDWLIIGGESGAGARPFDLAWARAAVERCRSAPKVPVFVKQIGALPTTVRRDPRAEGWTGAAIAHGNEETGALYELKPRDRKGGDPAEWPEDLRVREMPEAST